MITPENRGKIRENPGKTGQKPAKTGEILGTLFCDRPEQLLLMDFFDYLKKTFSADSGRTGRARANLRPFLDFGWPRMASKIISELETLQIVERG